MSKKSEGVFKSEYSYLSIKWNMDAAVGGVIFQKLGYIVKVKEVENGALERDDSQWARTRNRRIYIAAVNGPDQLHPSSDCDLLVNPAVPFLNPHLSWKSLHQFSDVPSSFPFQLSPSFFILHSTHSNNYIHICISLCFCNRNYDLST